MKRNRERKEKRGIVFRKNVSLARLSTFGVGGRAEYFYEAKTTSRLIEVLREVRNKGLRYRLFAGGSNVVFPDGLVRGLVIHSSGGRITQNAPLHLLVDGGVPLARLVKRSLNFGMRGLETLAGIPGSVGGAVVGNAGAYGHSISEIVERVEIFDGEKRIWISAASCCFSYRDSIFKRKPYVVLRALFHFQKGKPGLLERTAREIIRTRIKKYPRGLRCPGSFFKNVLVRDLSKQVLGKLDRSKIIKGKVPAGYLLEEVGAKGMRYGKLAVADYHGNLILNCGGATAREVRALARVLKGKVYRRFGIRLEEEVRYF